MDLKQLLQLVKQGEGQYLEFKRKANFPEKIAREFIAFANSGGGVLLLGVDDDTTVYGCKFPEEEEYAITNYLEQHCSPKIPYRIERVPVDAKHEVVVFYIAASKLRPHFLMGQGNDARKTAFVRVKDMSITASREMVSVMRFSEQTHGVRLQVGELEKRILSALESSPGTSLHGLAAQLSLGKRKVSDRLILLVRAGLLRIEPSPGGDRFQLNEKSFE